MVEKQTTEIDGRLWDVWTVDSVEVMREIHQDPGVKAAMDAESNRKYTRKITKYRFLQRLTPQEKAAILTASKTDALVEAFLFDFRCSEIVDLDEEGVSSGLDYLVDQGLLKAGRLNAITANNTGGHD
jgi:hypothetical protein